MDENYWFSKTVKIFSCLKKNPPRFFSHGSDDLCHKHYLLPQWFTTATASQNNRKLASLATALRSTMATGDYPPHTTFRRLRPPHIGWSYVINAYIDAQLSMYTLAYAQQSNVTRFIRALCAVLQSHGRRSIETLPIDQINLIKRLVSNGNFLLLTILLLLLVTIRTLSLTSCQTF